MEELDLKMNELMVEYAIEYSKEELNTKEINSIKSSIMTVLFKMHKSYVKSSKLTLDYILTFFKACARMSDIVKLDKELVKSITYESRKDVIYNIEFRDDDNKIVYNLYIDTNILYIPFDRKYDLSSDNYKTDELLTRDFSFIKLKNKNNFTKYDDVFRNMIARTFNIPVDKVRISLEESKNRNGYICNPSVMFPITKDNKELSKIINDIHIFLSVDSNVIFISLNDVGLESLKRYKLLYHKSFNDAELSTSFIIALNNLLLRRIKLNEDDLNERGKIKREIIRMYGEDTVEELIRGFIR